MRSWRRWRDSTNSWSPPSTGSIAAKAKRGGRAARLGSSLAPTTKPDRTETVAAPVGCAGCCADLAEAI